MTRDFLPALPQIISTRMNGKKFRGTESRALFFKFFYHA